jgi:predicted TIM-barrel fold metal-dependent hydrolase
MARLDLTGPDLVPQLDQFAADPLIAGIRLVFLPVDAGYLGDARQSNVWAAAAERGLPVMVHCPGQLAELAVIGQRNPRLRLAVDHLGLSGAQTDAAIRDEIQPLLDLAGQPGISVKVSALPCYSTQPYPHPALQDAVCAVIAAFGAERAFWGSDLSRLPGRYRDAVTLVRNHLGLDSGQSGQVLGHSLLDWLQWPE